MVDNQQEPNEENTHGIQISDQATEKENQDQSQSADNAGNEEGSEEKRVSFSAEQQAIFDKTVGKKVAKTHEITRERDELLRQLDETKAKLPQAEAPEIPELPDPDDFYGNPEGLKAAFEARDKLVNERAEFDAGVKQNEKAQADQTLKQQQERFQRQQKAGLEYFENAKTFDIKQEDIMKEATIVSQSVSPDIQDFLVEDAQGPLITNYLANNILELDKLKSMSTPQAAVYIANEVKPKLAGIKKTTETPHPLDMDEGQGMPDKMDKRLEGVKFT